LSKKKTGKYKTTEKIILTITSKTEENDPKFDNAFSKEKSLTREEKSDPPLRVAIRTEISAANTALNTITDKCINDVVRPRLYPKEACLYITMATTPNITNESKVKVIANLLENGKNSTKILV
jgi:hypothetical protein